MSAGEGGDGGGGSCRKWEDAAAEAEAEVERWREESGGGGRARPSEGWRGGGEVWREGAPRNSQRFLDGHDATRALLRRRTLRSPSYGPQRTLIC
uniref:Uncharacterized protein n=1 Tax=Oryza brachyantha TaxID=4533 RepID=J3MW98_ORYBR